jgi:UDP-N-acetylglucosamine pyrophosphorylase
MLQLRMSNPAVARLAKRIAEVRQRNVAVLDALANRILLDRGHLRDSPDGHGEIRQWLKLRYGLWIDLFAQD